jgi:hypothetical protein
LWEVFLSLGHALEEDVGTLDSPFPLAFVPISEVNEPPLPCALTVTDHMSEAMESISHGLKLPKL